MIDVFKFSKSKVVVALLTISTLFCGLVMASSIPRLVDVDASMAVESISLSALESLEFPSASAHCQPQNESTPSNSLEQPCWGTATLNSAVSLIFDPSQPSLFEPDDFSSAALMTVSLADPIRAGPEVFRLPLYLADFCPPSHRVLHCVLRL